MSALTMHRAATTDEIAAEMDRRGVVIEKLETDLWQWREECGKLHSQLGRAKVELSCANGGSLPLLYDIRRELGWNDKTSLSILATGVQRVRLALGGNPGDDLEALARSAKSAVNAHDDLVAALREARVAFDLMRDNGSWRPSTYEAVALIDAALLKANPAHSPITEKEGV
jgi:hypothetical protein